MDENRVKNFGAVISRLISKENLNREEVKDCFCQIMRNEQPDLQQGAFMAALTAKGETAPEIAGVWEAIYEQDTVRVKPLVNKPLVDNCGTGMDSLKTFNISTAASIVAAAGGVVLAKHGARALSGSLGTIDMLESLGVDVETDVETVRRSIETAGIGIFNGMSAKVHPQALFRILSQIRFGTTLNIAGSLANPALPRYAVRGVYSAELLQPVAEVMREIGYKKALVIYGSAPGGRGMDELSVLGESRIAELGEDGQIIKYSLSPADFGLKPGRTEDILTSGDKQRETLRLLRILSGGENGAAFNAVCLNAAPVFYIAGESDSLQQGYAKAAEIIRSGAAIAKLRQWVQTQNANPQAGLARLDSLLAELDGTKVS
ncbi:MAG: anthranilate phosphoribosyltransferase [Dehalococcoides mccartyi]|uniref:anthranilate phosphoribosyltransferase n=1 Tax=Dehalococcoides mccartyi TaxID=61435 RepID=UPI00242A8337|nr:anthranilate phosphoribosyltransferase [Dehalococcoides mccartyi]MCF7634573.1 anthranilate phosphoribosyltransferase [Dehalococcoides mccartyi]MEA2121862.1 Anthranilate phosphoribosyltransferase [Dehalococcoides mccartyi]MEA2121925.1 Anthranilate phosphoribosyltransferase [Dehalococcoides mccartyi]